MGDTENVEVTNMETYHREFIGDKGSHILIDLSLEDVSEAVKKKVLSQLELFTLDIHGIIMEGGGI